MKRAILIGALAVALAPVVVHAQSAGAPAARALTLDTALGTAKRANRTLAVEKARLAGARTNIEQAWAALFPIVTAQGKYTHNYKNATLDFGRLFTALGYPPMTMGQPLPAELSPTILKQEQLDASINLTMPLIVPAAYPGLDAVKKGVRSSEASYEASESNVLLNVAQVFFLAAAADEVLVSRQSNIEVSRATLENAKTRFAAGTVTKVDVDRAELALVRAQQIALDAEYARQQSYRALATLMQDDVPFKVVPPEVPLKTPVETFDAALNRRPEFRALILTEESADATRRAYGWRWSPQLVGFAKANVGNYVGFTGDRYAWSVGLQLDWTIFDGGTRDAQRHLAAAQAAQAEAQSQVLADNIRDDLQNGRVYLETKRAALLASLRAVTLAQETLELVRSQYEAGTVTQVDLLQAQDNLVSAQEALAQARFDVSVADVNLRHAAGTFPGKS
ncbi:MAG: TolC family protein [Pseudomonadota bacterium]